MILTSEGYKAVEDLRKGMLVKTHNDGYRAIDAIGKRTINHVATKTPRIKDQLYQYPPLAESFEPLVITGGHSVLVESFASEEEAANTQIMGRIYKTSGLFRLLACVDERAAVFEPAGDYTVYHFALENEDPEGAYGIYANGVLVESCSNRYLLEESNLEIL
jgi:hypothetical protein